MTSAPPSLTIVVPTFNEERRLPPTLATLHRWLADGAVPGLERIVVSDDGSVDGTADLVHAASRTDPRILLDVAPVNRGKGAALRRGFRAATTDLVAFVDADLPVPLESLTDLLATAERSDLVAGTRTAAGSRFVRPQPIVRRLGGRAFVAAAALLGFRQVSDPQCGVKVLRRETMGPVVERCRCDRFAFDIELVTLAAEAGLSVTERPVVWIHVDGSTVRPLRDAAITLRELVSLRRNGR